MNLYAKDFWRRANQSLATARAIAASDPDAAASRAYYAAFYAVSALFALESREFSKHSAVESAVHRHLVNAGRWPTNLGADYHDLRALRAMGDYGRLDHVAHDAAEETVEKAQRILEAVQEACPQLGDSHKTP
ncbi:MAG: HEPN domain-containing protein [Planctomycetes bacterium]|nr:HEPN domain-containing protein [Planctomycetota bacterium]MBU4397936.1 HEPN domain-containing protein [Planctomycetota bacterium]MCG2683971.1 HEPN domain-containing protein [Planctomycetales bacterium]